MNLLAPKASPPPGSDKILLTIHCPKKENPITAETNLLFFHKKIPANDAGISAGQAIYGVYNA